MRRSRVGSLLTGVVLLGATAFAGSDRPAYADAFGCDVGVEADFNNDSRSDTVVADPYATVNGQAEAGRIVVLFGDADGLVGEGSRGVIYQGLDSIGGIADSGDHFGASMAVADIDCDGFTDVVVGAPDEDINGQSNSGYAQVIYGSVAGLSMGKASRNLTQANFGLPITAGDQFGYAVDALEDVGQGGTPASSAYAIAIGAPGANVDGLNDAGLVAFLAPLDGGNVATLTTQNSPGIPGAAEAGDRFGAAVSLNYLSGVDDFVDCAVGAPNEDVGSVTNAGAVTVVQDIYDFAEAGIGLDQNAAGVPGSAESGDQFGRSLDTVQVGATSRLAVGLPGENVGSDANAGVVQLFYSGGVDLNPGSTLSQDTAGVGDSTQPGDIFGDKVAWAAPGLGDTATRLAVSATKEDGVANETGMVQVFPINSLGSESSYTQNTAGIPGVAAAADHFGSSLAVVEGATERVLLVGVPDDTANATGMVDIIPFGGGTPRSWQPGTGGVPTGGASMFGDALASVTG